MPKAPKSVRPLSPLKDLPFKVVFLRLIRIRSRIRSRLLASLKTFAVCRTKRSRNLVIADPGVPPKSNDGNPYIGIAKDS